MKAPISVMGELLPQLTLVGLLIAVAASPTALAQTRPERGIPDTSGPDASGNQPLEFQQSGRFVNLTRGLSSLGEVDDDLPDPDPPFCLNNPGDPSCDALPRRHFSIRVPRDLTQFTVWLFDGDTRKQGGGSFSWDNCQGNGCSGLMNEIQYTLFLDPSGPLEATQVPAGQAPRANANPDDVVDAFFGVSMPDNRWTGFTVEQAPGACGDRLLPDRTTQVPHGMCGYHLVLHWLPNTAPEPVLLTDEQANFKVGVAGPGVSVFIYDQSNLGYIGYNGLGPNFPGPTTFDGTFAFTIPVNFDTEPVWFTPLLEGDFDVANDGDDPNFLGLPIFPSINALPEGVMPGDPADGDDSSDLLLGWTVPEAPNAIYALIAPGNIWTRMNLNPSGDREWERFALSKEAAGPPPPMVDDVVPSIPNGDYRLEVRGLDARNTIFISFNLPVTDDPGGSACEGDLVQLTLRNNGPDADLEVKSEGGVSLGKYPQVLGGGTFLVNISDPTPSIQVNDTTIPTSCGSDVSRDGDDDVVDRLSPCKVIGPGRIFGDFEVVNGVSSIGGPLVRATDCTDSQDQGIDHLSHSDGYCLPKSASALRSLTLEYRGEDCDFTTNQQSGKVKCRARGSLPKVAQIRITGGGRVYFDGSNVSLGSEIVLTPPDSGSPMAPDIKARIENRRGKLVQLVKFHSSCSEPLERGDQFGSLLVKELVATPK